MGKIDTVCIDCSEESHALSEPNPETSAVPKKLFLQKKNNFHLSLMKGDKVVHLKEMLDFFCSSSWNSSFFSGYLVKVSSFAMSPAESSAIEYFH